MGLGVGVPLLARVAGVLRAGKVREGQAGHAVGGARVQDTWLGLGLGLGLGVGLGLKLGLGLGLGLGRGLCVQDTAVEVAYVHGDDQRVAAHQGGGRRAA